MMGDYIVDLSRRPARIDITNFGFSKGVTSICCMAIAEFPDKDTMNICGLFGKCDEVQRPVKFDRKPSDNHQLYLELKKVR